MTRTFKVLIGLGLLAFLIFGITRNTQASEQPQVVRVSVKDYQVDLSQFVVTPGRTVRFVVENNGSLPHQLTIQALSSSVTMPNMDNPVIGPGTSRTVQFSLQPGIYRVVCAVADHVEKGMVNVFAADAVRSASFPFPMDIAIPFITLLLGSAFIIGDSVGLRLTKS
jgi:plastocyanin